MYNTHAHTNTPTQTKSYTLSWDCFVQLNNYLTRIDNLLVEREDRLVAQVPAHPAGHTPPWGRAALPLTAMGSPEGQPARFSDSRPLLGQ
jgi:hypothetical protein